MDRKADHWGRQVETEQEKEKHGRQTCNFSSVERHSEKVADLVRRL